MTINAYIMNVIILYNGYILPETAIIAYIGNNILYIIMAIMPV